MDPIRTPRRFRCRWCRWSRPAWYTVAGELTSGGEQLVSHCEVEHPAETGNLRRWLDDEGKTEPETCP